MVNTKAKILIVEDDRMQIEMYVLRFSKAGYDMISAENAQDGFVMAEKEMPDLILLDVVMGNFVPMPGISDEEKAYRMEGIKLLKKLKKHSATKNIPVVLVTNLDKHYLREEGRKLGAVDFIVKATNNPTEILKRVEKILN